MRCAPPSPGLRRGPTAGGSFAGHGARRVHYDHGMLHVFVATIAPGHDPESIFSEETLQETQAQVMTPAEASAVGLSGVVEIGRAHV